MKNFLCILLICCIMTLGIDADAAASVANADVTVDGGNITIFGNSKNANSNVRISVLNPSGDTVHTALLTSDSEGNFDTVVLVANEADAGTYTVTAETLSSSGEVLTAEEPEVIIVSANRDGKYININGSVSTPGKRYISFYVENSLGQLVYVAQTQSNDSGAFKHICPLTYNIDGEEYKLIVGATGISNPTEIAFNYTDRTSQATTNKFFNGDLLISFTNGTRLTGTLECSPGKKINITITNESDKQTMVSDTITAKDGIKSVDYKLYYDTNDRYSFVMTVEDDSSEYTKVVASITPRTLYISFGGNVSVAKNVWLDTSFEATHEQINNKEKKIDQYTTFNTDLPYWLINLSTYRFVFSGYEQYTHGDENEISKTKNSPLYTALKNNRPELDFDNDGVITSGELASITGYLDLRNSNIYSLSGLGKCTFVSALYADGNNIPTLAPLASMQNLEYLSVSGNNLTDLHGVPENVRYVQASYNEITGLLGLKDADKLESLTASHNKIVSADGLENKKNLRYLKLNNNDMSDISALAGCTSLVHLDFENNKVEDIKSLAGMKFLKYLVFRNNPVKDGSYIPYNKFHTLKFWSDWMEEIPQRDTLH